MLVNKPEDRSKVIALSVLIVFCILYFFVMVLPRLLHGGSPAPHPGEAAVAPPASPPAPAFSAGPVPNRGPAPAGGPATGAPVTLAQRQPGTDETTDTSGGPFPAATRDPFRPPVPSTPPPVVEPPHPTVVALRKPIIPETLPSIKLPTFTPGPTSAFPGPANTPAPVAPLPEVTLKGVIPGNPAVAVLQLGTETLHKYPGELLAPDLRLSRITDDGVVLKHGKQNITLDVGRSTKEASPSGPGENEITTVEATPPAPAPAKAARPAGKDTAGKPTGEAAVAKATAPDGPAGPEAAAPSKRAPAPKPQKHIVFYRAHRRRSHYGLFYYRNHNGYFVRYQPGHGWHALYVRRHGRFVRYHLRHRRHSAAA